MTGNRIIFVLAATPLSWRKKDKSSAYNSFVEELKRNQLLPEAGDDWYVAHLKNFWTYSRPEKKFRFSKVVIDTMTRVMPEFVYEKTTSVWFKKAGYAKTPKLNEVLDFQKGPYGADNFVVRQAVTFSGRSKEGFYDYFFQIGQCGADALGRHGVEFGSKGDIEKWIKDNAVELAKEIEKEAAPYYKEYLHLDRLLGDLPLPYSKWHKKQGAAFSTRDFRWQEPSENQRRSPVAYASFIQYLKQDKILLARAGNNIDKRMEYEVRTFWARSVPKS